ncbi:MAG: UDP-N-acetylmuramate dehydrogenase [Candidatus Falkowbacteria bacterium]|nr:UDP-N-acetylmuramate dehydrogenase [Candidatus Falkowbacteria bacterium]
MLKIEPNKNLTRLTTLQIGAPAEFFAVIKSREDLDEAIVWAKKNKKTIWILGGGSNVLISKKIVGLVLKNEIRGMAIKKEGATTAIVEAKSGESWIRFVNFTVEHNLSGLENLFLIYGTVGAAPVQNIGAYGVELKDVFYSLTAIDLKTGCERIFKPADCRFGYRDSIFKNKLKGRYFIYSVAVKLSKKPSLKLDYGSLREKLAEQGIKKPSLKDVVAAIAEIRNSKLPNPGTLPNAGSFFKNIETSLAIYKKLLKKYPGLPFWPVSAARVKIPAGWLIENAGFKGKKFGSVGMHDKQALILVNYGGASAKQAGALVKKVKAAVKKKFGLDLEEEVNII